MKNLMKYMMIMAIAILLSANAKSENWIYKMICSGNDHNVPKFLNGKRYEIYDIYSRDIDTLNLENDPLSPFDAFTHPSLIRRPASGYLIEYYGIVILKIRTIDIPIDILNKFSIKDTMPEFKYLLFKTASWNASAYKERMQEDPNYKSILIEISDGNAGFLISYLGIYNEDEIKIIKNAKDKKEIENILINNPYILSIY